MNAHEMTNEEATAKLHGLLEAYPGYLKIITSTEAPLVEAKRLDENNQWITVMIPLPGFDAYVIAPVTHFTEGRGGMLVAHAEGGHKSRGYPLPLLTRLTEFERSKNVLNLPLLPGDVQVQAATGGVGVKGKAAR